MTHVHLTIKSTNAKTGPIPVSTTSMKSCPSTCPFKANGCYADSGPLRLHWQKVTNKLRGMPWSQFCKEIAKLPEGSLWRHNQAGDLPHTAGTINTKKLLKLINANSGRKGFTYTHHDVLTNPTNSLAIWASNTSGFTVNLSANTIDEADELYNLHIAPVAVTLHSGETRKSFRSPNDVRIVTCPATLRDDVTCESCGLCAIATRRCIVGFPSHGTSKRKVDNYIKEN